MVASPPGPLRRRQRRRLRLPPRREHPGQTTPTLLYRPEPAHPTLGTTPNQQHETALDPEHIPGPIAYTGPGALAAARATAISTLATPGHALHTDPDLATELLGPNAHHEPGWLETTRPSTETDTPQNQDPHTTVIRSAPTDTTAGADHGPATILLGEPADDEDTTVLDIETDGTLRAASGPAATHLAGTRIHTFTQQSAADLYQTICADTDPPLHPQLTNQTTATNPKQPEPWHEPRRPRTSTDTAADPRTLTNAQLILRVLGDLDILGPANPDPTPIRPPGKRRRTPHPPRPTTPTVSASTPCAPSNGKTTTDDHRAHIALTTAINRIRTPFRTALGDTAEPLDPVLHDKTRQTYRLNLDLITTDLALIQHLTHQAEAAEPSQKLALLTQAAALHRGQLAPRLDDNQRDWLTTARYTQPERSSRTPPPHRRPRRKHRPANSRPPPEAASRSHPRGPRHHRSRAPRMPTSK